MRSQSFFIIIILFWKNLGIKAVQAWVCAAKYIWMCEEITGKNYYLRK